LTKVLYRKPYGTQWEVVDLDWAMDRVAELVKKTRDETFVETLPNGKRVMHTTAIFSTGWRDDRQRVEPHSPEADARPGDCPDREPGADMTQLDRPRSGDSARARWRDQPRG
jgi:hypothetical protein